MRGFSVVLAFGKPVRPQMQWGKAWLRFRVAIGPVALSVVPLDLESVMVNYGNLLRAVDELNAQTPSPEGTP
jgi:type II secretory pathway component PulL